MDIKKDLIINKISLIVKSGISSESEVLYLLAEIRKFNEHDEKEKTTLDFYCDWAVHARLNYRKTTNLLLGSFDQYIVENKTSKEIATDFKQNRPEFFKLEILKKELDEFLTENSLPIKLITDNKCWNRFVKFLLEILKESSILPETGKIASLSVEEDKFGITSFKFRLKNRKDCPMIKLKWK